MTELTKQQTDRQDFVDNAIYTLVDSLVPEPYRSDTETGGTGIRNEDNVLDWDIEWIAELRDDIQAIIGTRLGVIDPYTPPTPEKLAAWLAFEQAFYPYTED